MTGKELQLPKVATNDYGIRPAGPQDACLYCHQKVGRSHAFDCVILSKLVRIEFKVTLKVPVPLSWGTDLIEFKYNDGTWCADNLADMIFSEVGRRNEGDTSPGCMCDDVSAKFIEIVDETPRIIRDDGSEQKEDLV